MRVTTKGQVTIPQHIREKLGIVPSTDIEFVEEKEALKDRHYPTSISVRKLLSSKWT